MNTAIVLPGNIIGSLTTANSLGIIVRLVAGKLIGIFTFPYLLVKLGLASIVDGITWKHLAGIGLLGGIGFTMSMFISNLAFADAALGTTSKLSILIGSTLAAIGGILIFITGKPAIDLTDN